MREYSNNYWWIRRSITGSSKYDLPSYLWDQLPHAEKEATLLDAKRDMALGGLNTDIVNKRLGKATELMTDQGYSPNSFYLHMFLTPHTAWFKDSKVSKLNGRKDSCFYEPLPETERYEFMRKIEMLRQNGQHLDGSKQADVAADIALFGMKWAVSTGTEVITPVDVQISPIQKDADVRFSDDTGFIFVANRWLPLTCDEFTGLSSFDDFCITIAHNGGETKINNIGSTIEKKLNEFVKKGVRN